MAMNEVIKIIVIIIATGGGIILVDVIRNTYRKRNGNKNTEWDGIERRTGIINLADEIREMRNEFNTKIKDLADKVDSWANKLLEHYSTKRETDKIRDKVQEVDNKLSGMEKEITSNKEATDIIFDKLGKIFDKITKAGK